MIEVLRFCSESIGNYLIFTSWLVITLLIVAALAEAIAKK